jgi:hypothetical protein
MKMIFSLLFSLLMPTKFGANDALLQLSVFVNQRYTTDALGSLPDAIASPTQRSLRS